MASWSVRSSLDRAVRVRDLAGDIVLCSWARHLTLTVLFSTQVYKWVPANLTLGVTLRWTGIPSRGSRNTPSRFMPQKPELSAGLMGQLARMQTLPYLGHTAVDSETFRRYTLFSNRPLNGPVIPCGHLGW